MWYIGAFNEEHEASCGQWKKSRICAFWRTSGAHCSTFKESVCCNTNLRREATAKVNIGASSGSALKKWKWQSFLDRFANFDSKDISLMQKSHLTCLANLLRNIEQYISGYFDVSGKVCWSQAASWQTTNKYWGLRRTIEIACNPQSMLFVEMQSWLKLCQVSQ